MMTMKLYYYDDGMSILLYIQWNQTPLGQKKVSLLVRCPDFRDCNVHKRGVIWDSLMCPVYQSVLISGCPE